MKKSKYSDAEVMSILRQAEGGVPVSELCREHGMSSASFYKWRSKFGGMDASMMSELKSMADENRLSLPKTLSGRIGNDLRLMFAIGYGRYLAAFGSFPALSCHPITFTSS